MTDSLIAAYAGLEARLRTVEVVSNNLANAQTIGFKRDLAHFTEKDDIVTGETRTDFTPGQLTTTGNPLDAAINGPGFFVIDTPNGRRYTRNGSFGVNQAGELVTKDGSRVLSTSNSTIRVGDGSVEIRDGGTVLVDGVSAGELRIVEFREPDRLVKEGLQRFIWTGDDAAVSDVRDPQVSGAHIERSNVNAVEEMIRLMAAYREFESIQRTLRTANSEMNARLVQELGRLS